jgi:putative FmdB family regulatory protein
MPTYEYKCGACGDRYEMFQSMTEPPKKRCPKCGKNTAERLIGTGAGVLFKGSGFYETDYRSESYKKAAEAEKKPVEKADSKTEKPKTETPGKKPKKKPAKSE